MPSERFTLDLSPRLPVCCPTRDSHAAGAGLDARTEIRLSKFQTGFSGLRLHYRSLQRMFDARARPRAVNPPPREAPASVRVRLHARFPAGEGSPGDCSPARPLPIAPTHCLRSLYRPGGFAPVCSIPGSAPPRSPASGVSTLCEFCLSGARAETALVRDEHDRVLRRP
jgi:hypothetical protein